jgi:hypothetical protein
MNTSFVDPSDTFERRRERRIEASRRQWPEYPAKDLEPVGRFVVDLGSGNLFVPVLAAVLPGDSFGHGPRVDAFYLSHSTGEPVYLERSQSPSTLEELREQEESKRTAEREREQAQDKFVRDQPLRTLRLCDLDNDWAMPTVREAARLLLDHGCRIENHDGHLVVQIPEQLDPNGNHHLEAMKHIIRAARVLDAAGPVVLDELAKTKQTKRLDERLPDKHAGAFGGVAR